MTDRASLPLCVDLDETLLLDDTFRLGLKRLWRDPLRIPAFLVRLAAGGRPAAKDWLAEKFPLDPATLRYRGALVAYLRAEKASGRKLYLVSAASQKIVDAVARHLGLFDGAYGSGARGNLKGRRKAAFIIEKIGPRFCYAGDSHADLAVWNRASAAILCGKAVTLRAALRPAVEAAFGRRDRHHRPAA